MSNGSNQQDDLPKLSQPARHALFGAGYNDLEQVASANLSQIKQLHGVGRRGIEQLRIAMNEKGLSFADEKPGAVLSEGQLAADVNR